MRIETSAIVHDMSKA